MATYKQLNQRQSLSQFEVISFQIVLVLIVCSLVVVPPDGQQRKLHVYCEVHLYFSQIFIESYLLTPS